MNDWQILQSDRGASLQCCAAAALGEREGGKVAHVLHCR